MLPARHRLRRHRDFQAALARSPDRYRGSGRFVALSLTTGATASAGPAGSVRAGFIVSKAVGPAVVRNRVKRRLRALVRDRLAQLPSGSDLVVRAAPPAAAASGAELAGDLDAALQRLLGRTRP